ncbi:MAG TPA: DmsC/YnfH family molybdoenzyme membrane anchor subunit [Casimicrobiaceae bacterium]|nr:DmsC/YnfH family molybdoenzyme membrane anchor subunit [Casimicrobiaceae bacterium]
MHPAFSVIFLTTLIGAGQGLFVAIYTAQWVERLGWLPVGVARDFDIAGTMISMALTIGGLLASFFHLGRPERAWRSAARWRTSWLSREVIALPAFLGATGFYGAAMYLHFASPLAAGAPAALACLALFVCTGMVYAGIRFLREWASPLTLVNFALLGCASGFTIAAALSTRIAPELFVFMANGAVALTVAGLATRTASLVRNARLKPKSTLQSAVGIRHPRIVQIAQGFMGGSFNTREFFHGVGARAMRSIRSFFLAAAFVLPIALLGFALVSSTPALAIVAALVQAAGLIAERWYFLAQANHPQNLYYQSQA